MSGSSVFEFGSGSVASAYEDVLVPVIFVPWATRLVEEGPRWEGATVLDLATGTGVLAQLIAERVGAEGRVIGADINAEMLVFARRRCAGMDPEVSFVETAAHPLEISSGTADIVVCQQGFQFFPDRGAAAGEIFRVLRDRGRVIVSTWCPVAECELFGAICGALEAIEEHEMAQAMRTPFDFLPESELSEHFAAAGFASVAVQRQALALVLEGGVEHAINVAYGSPIGPQLHALSEERQAAFRCALIELVDTLGDDGVTMGNMVSNVLTAQKDG